MTADEKNTRRCQNEGAAAAADAPPSAFADRMFSGQRSAFRRYLYALLLTLIALGVRLAIAPLDGGIQYVTFFPAVALAAVIGGFGPGLLSAAVSVALATYLFWPPHAAFTLEFRHATVLSNVVFLIDALLVSASVEAMHRFYRRSVDAEQRLKLAASVFENSAEGVIVTNAEGIIQAVNPAFADITGYAPEEAVGQRPNILRSDHQPPEFYRDMWAALANAGRWEGELWNRRKNGEAQLVWMTIAAVKDQDGVAMRHVGVFHDITAMREKDAHFRHMAFHDPLTGLPNRALLQDRLQHALARAQRENRRLAIMFVDLDGFKAVNDQLGHDIGDLLLKEVAFRITSRLRDMDTVARLGGDEFVILMEDVGDAEDCAGLAGDPIGAISAPMQLHGRTAHVGASIGIAVYPDDGDDTAQLMKVADEAMYAAKAAGRNTYRLSA